MYAHSQHCLSSGLERRPHAERRVGRNARKKQILPSLRVERWRCSYRFVRSAWLLQCAIQQSIPWRYIYKQNWYKKKDRCDWFQCPLPTVRWWARFAWNVPLRSIDSTPSQSVTWWYCYLHELPLREYWQPSSPVRSWPGNWWNWRIYKWTERYNAQVAWQFKPKSHWCWTKFDSEQSNFIL